MNRTETALTFLVNALVNYVSFLPPDQKARFYEAMDAPIRTAHMLLEADTRLDDPKQPTALKALAGALPLYFGETGEIPKSARPEGSFSLWKRIKIFFRTKRHEPK